MTSPPSTIECRIADHRRERGWTQRELAERIQVGRQFVHEMESGRRLPNTGIALKLARLFGCAVEDLFVERGADLLSDVHLLPGAPGSEGRARLALARVRDRLVGVPLSGAAGLQAVIPEADALPSPDGGLTLLVPEAELARRVILTGCDPAFDLLRAHTSRTAPKLRTHVVFASSRAALQALGQGAVHLAGTHFANAGTEEANLAAVHAALPNIPALVLGFSLLEEGLMVAPGNSLGIAEAADLIRPGLRFVNREPGAALRSLLHRELARSGADPTLVPGHDRLVRSHAEGAAHVACGAADAALGLRVVAEAYGLSFVSLAVTRCDLVVPADLRDHPGVAALLEAVQSSGLRRELDALPGYDSGCTGQVIAAPS